MKKYFEQYLKEFVYGALDGTVTTFAIIAGSAGASLGSGIVLILGISNVLADGFSMASSNYLSEKSERDQMDRVAINPFRKAFATFISFILVGSIPLLPYVLNLTLGVWESHIFLMSCIFTSVAFLLVGKIRGKITRKNQIFAGLETLLIGGVAAIVAYSVGAFLDKIIG